MKFKELLVKINDETIKKVVRVGHGFFLEDIKIPFCESKLQGRQGPYIELGCLYKYFGKILNCQASAFIGEDDQTVAFLSKDHNSFMIVERKFPAL